MSRLKPTPQEIARFTQVLAQTPVRIQAVTAGLDEANLRQALAARQWSVADVLAHLRACAELWSYSIYAMLAEDEPVLALIDERRWARAARWSEAPFHLALQAFNLQRSELLAVLAALSPAGWERRATIAGRGHSVNSQVRRMALHEEEHSAQIEALCRGYRGQG